jgi:DNA repair exonuclease SbcCD ATPase subunit
MFLTDAMGDRDMTWVLGFGGVRRAAALVLIGMTATLLRAAPVQAEPNAGADSFAPVEEYARKVEEFTKNAPALNKKIEDGTKTIDDLTDVSKARAEIEQLRGVVADLLGRVSDNGELGRLGAKALDHARTKLKTLEQETRFKPEEREFLTRSWRELIGQTERAADDLEKARQEFSELLKVLQTREDFIDELMQIKRAAEATKVIRQLTSDLRDASAKLKTLISVITPPGV